MAGTSWQGLQDDRARAGKAGMTRTANVVHSGAVVEGLHSSGRAREEETDGLARTLAADRQRKQGKRMRAIYKI